MSRRVLSVTAAAFVALLLVASCSSDGGGDTATDDTAPSASDTSAGDASTTTDPAEASLGPAAGTPSEPTGGADWPMHGHDLGSQRNNAEETEIGPEQAPDMEVAWQVDELLAVTGTPAVVEGVLYIGDWTGNVRALDAETGEEIWVSEVGGQIAGSPSVTEDAVYVAVDKSTHRLNRETGEIEWSVEVNDHDWTRIYAGPTIVEGVVVQPISGVQIAVPQDDYTFRGNVVGLDEATGDELWRVYISEDDETSGAGGSVWAGASADPERNLTFVGTGNTLEEPTSPLADSLIAIDYTTGEIKWSTQFTNPDVYNMPQANGADGPDSDLGSTPTLWSVGERDLVGAGDKAGMFHAVDRDTGEVVWETQLTPGSRLGGVIGGSAFADGRIFVASNVGDPVAAVPTGVSTLFALDAGTGEILWQSNMELTVFGPAAVANGVVYQGTGFPRMYAFNAETGALLREYDPPAPVGGGASVVDGHVYWGYGYWVIGAPDDPKGGLIAFAAAD